MNAADSQKLAAIVQESLNKALGITDRGVRQAPFRVLVGSTCPSVLVELGFITNPEDEALLSKPDYRDKLADALHAAVRRYRDSSTP
ncbi:MAG: N-acetylmuramoyl-L-alanine amidase [Acidobacteriota bacterium]